MNGEQFQNFQLQKDWPSKTRKNILPVLIFFIISLICLVGAFLASRIWDPSWNPFGPNPEKVIEKMFLMSEKIKTYERKIEFLVNGKNKGEFEFKLKIEGKTDITRPENPKNEAKFDILLSLTENETLTDLKVALAGEEKKMDEKFYLKFVTLPDIPILKTVGIDVSRVKGCWIKFDKESMPSFIKKATAGNWMPEIEKKMKEEIERQNIFEKKFQEKEFQEKLIKILSGRKFYLFKKKLANEKISGTKVYHYLFILDKKEILETIFEIWKIIGETTQKEHGVFFEHEFKKKLKEVIDKLGDIEVEIWIGKKDYLPYRVKLEKKIDLSSFGEEGEVLVRLKVENSKFNQPIIIEPPSDFKDISEILTSVLEEYGEVLRETPNKTKDIIIKNNIEEMRMVAELLYTDEKSYKNLCKGSALNEDHPVYGKDLTIIKNDIEKTLGGVINLTCYSSVNSFCVTVDLSSPGQGKYCIDFNFNFTAEKLKENSRCLGKGTKTDPYRCPQEKELSETKLFPLRQTSSFLGASVLKSILRLFNK